MDGMDGYHDMEGMAYGDESAGMSNDGGDDDSLNFDADP